jgi:hypothetical protein
MIENLPNPGGNITYFAQTAPGGVRLADTFTGSADPNATSTPYNQFISSGLHTAYPNTQAGLGTENWDRLEAVLQRQDRDPYRRGHLCRRAAGKLG